MSNAETLVVTVREKLGKAASRDLRKAGMIPATIYGLNEPAISVAVSPKALARIIASESGMNSLIYAQREGTDIKRHVIIKDLQRDPVTGRLRHVDLLRVDPNHKVRVHVPIVLKGNPVGVKEGGILDFVHRVIEVECLPSFIPANITVNVSAMKVGDSLRLDEINLDSHLTVIGDIHNVICAIQGRPAEEEAPVAEEAPAAAPAKGKK